MVQLFFVGHPIASAASELESLSSRRAIFLDPWTHQGPPLAETFWRSCEDVDVAVVLVRLAVLVQANSKKNPPQHVFGFCRDVSCIACMQIVAVDSLDSVLNHFP